MTVAINLLHLLIEPLIFKNYVYLKCQKKQVEYRLDGNIKC